MGILLKETGFDIRTFVFIRDEKYTLKRADIPSGQWQRRIREKFAAYHMGDIYQFQGMWDYMMENGYLQ